MSWLRKLGFPGPKPKTPDGLARDWNAQGRAYFTTMSSNLTAYHERAQTFDVSEDPRGIEMAKAVVAQVQVLNDADAWQTARSRFDPAHEPFIPLLKDRGQNLSCVTILGPDACLVRLGSGYQNGATLHIDKGRLTTLADVLACKASPARDWLLLVRADGFHVRPGLNDADAYVLPWPCEVRCLDTLSLSDDGRRIAFAHDELGIWIGDAALGKWLRAHPTDQDIAEARIEMEDDDYEWSESMVHCDLSPDGRFLAYGTQSGGHWLDAVGEDLTLSRWANINPDIDYPHDARFSHDGRYVALNGCHFYNGETLVVDVAASQGLEKPDYDPDPRTPVIDQMLRVYASTWLPPEAAGIDSGAFVLAGLGYVTAVTPAGKVLFSQYFGSSASSIDYCPRTRRLFLGSYSGMLHVYDIDRQAAAEETYGYCARHEVYRWVLWKDEAPFRW